ncbi:hypothetical protein EW146_g3408 [Bondarzewia mesenterica]|uniref:Pentacotripeptide-repeat region of PRORP domain-containing protein n=1 Tax=Bondarzewia mesenterica TaxID=1095465 RepID=A0A4S4LY41_9AGAM|nr:hypothetical protein EW146_g3408 [Bondarzewia mesenterica]
MLVRHAGKRPAVLLDFLAPNLSSRRANSTDVGTGSVKPLPKKTWSHVASVLPSFRSSDSKILLSNINERVQSIRARPSELDMDAFAFNRHMTALQKALQARDVATAWSRWKVMKNLKLLHFIGPSETEGCSRLIADICYLGSTLPWDERAKDALEEMAMFFGVRRSTEALKACLVVHIQRGDAAAVLSLYQRFIRRPWKYLSKHESVEEDSPKEVQEETDTALASTSPSYLVSILPRSHDILLAAITAHAMQNDFTAAIHTVLDSPYHFYRSAKAAIWCRKTSTALLVSRSQSLKAHITNLAASRSGKELKLFYDSVIEGFSDEYPWLAIDQSKVSHTRPVWMSGFSWHNFLQVFLQQNMMDMAEKAWDDMIRFGQRPTVHIWTALMNGVAELRGVDRALVIWDAMLADGVRPNSAAYVSIISALLKERRLDDAVNKFNEYREGRLLDEESNVPELVFNAMLHGYLNHSRTDDARDLLAYMKEHGPKPETITYNTFLAYYHKCRNYKAISATLQTIASEGLQGDVFTFSTLLCSLLQIIDRQEAIDRTNRIMDKHGVKPNVATYSAIIASLVEERSEANLRAALDLLRAMEEDGNADVHPNVVTYTNILTAIHRWPGLDPQLAEDYTDYISKRMRKRKVAFNKVTYNILIKACLANPEPQGLQKALQYYRRMSHTGVPLTGDTWHILLRGLLERGDVALANELVSEMENSDVTISTALKGLADEVKRRASWKATSGPKAYF